MAILSIQSQVIYGHVGNSAAAFALQRHGHEVWSLPTAILAHHPGHGSVPAVRYSSAAEMDAWVDALARLPAWAGQKAAITGWLGKAEAGEAARRAIRRATALNPRMLYLCDPVLGDQETGLYVAADLVDVFRKQLLPMAHVATPNGFEIEQLTGEKTDSLPAALKACDALRALGPETVVATTLNRKDGGLGKVEALLVTGEGAWLAAVPDLGRSVAKGAGDLFAALLLARLLRGKPAKKALGFAMAAVYVVLRDALMAGSPEMRLEAAQGEIMQPSFEPPIERVR